uniref:Uncharacterized protein n=1 Tax=Tetranychus urticae TaxID=32264 RepID=T1JQG2_TETUR
MRTGIKLSKPTFHQTFCKLLQVTSVGLLEHQETRINKELDILEQ